MYSLNAGIMKGLPVATGTFRIPELAGENTGTVSHFGKYHTQRRNGSRSYLRLRISDLTYSRLPAQNRFIPTGIHFNIHLCFLSRNGAMTTRSLSHCEPCCISCQSENKSILYALRSLSSKGLPLLSSLPLPYLQHGSTAWIPPIFAQDHWLPARPG